MLPMNDTASVSMKKLIFCDIDGSLNLGKNISLDLEVLTQIKKLIPRLSEKGIGFTLSTGPSTAVCRGLCPVAGFQPAFGL